MLDCQLSGNEIYLSHYQKKIGYLASLGTSLGGFTREQSIYTVLSMWVCTLHNMGTCSRDLCLILSFHVDFHNCVFSIRM